jgi:hypothetical protein
MSRLADFHKDHAPCVPGKCQCRCGCERILGCTAFSGVCSECYLNEIRGRNETCGLRDIEDVASPIREKEDTTVDDQHPGG